MLQLVGGLTLLTFGAEVLIRNAVKLALAARISPLVVGLTVVAFGTSAPELVVSVQSVLTGEPEIALGNVVGSNICNVLLILGLSALITPLIVDIKLIRFDVPLMIGVVVLMWIFALNGLIGRLEGVLLFCGLISFTVWSIVASRRSSTPAIEREFAEELPVEAEPATAGKVLLWIVLFAGSLLLLAIGSQM